VTYRLGQYPEGILNVTVCILSGSRGDPESEQGVLLLYFVVPERMIHIIACYSAICPIGHKEISLDVWATIKILWHTWALVTVSLGASNSAVSINIFLRLTIIQHPKLDDVENAIGGLYLKPRSHIYSVAAWP